MVFRQKLPYLPLIGLPFDLSLNTSVSLAVYCRFLSVCLFVLMPRFRCFTVCGVLSINGVKYYAISPVIMESRPAISGHNERKLRVLFEVHSTAHVR